MVNYWNACVNLEERLDEVLRENDELKERIEELERESDMYRRFWEEVEYQMSELKQEYLA